MADTQKQKENMSQDMQRNAPGNDRDSLQNQPASRGGNRREYGNKAEYQNTHNTPDENPQPGRRR